ncbi:FRIGIDA-like protein 4a [Tripterygium wilfordii]|uniref:FRIGIDA-like protein n=1 Tax=Tripterygium wilfordii TaxID=458696 RepID=A0A7J7D9B9_TRIWF|nr:FRIGIDA-like protein 4a [Tripterygium wilfordii]KAF5742960.1 FRIGIDA-like protein 4a [Tripterygium wilfordii]
MATEADTKADRVQIFFRDLENQKVVLSSCTQLFTALSNHFASLQDSLSQRSQSIESKFQSLESNAKETLDSLSLRENSISGRESAATARIEEQKEVVISEFRNSDKYGWRDSLKSFCRKMDSTGLVKFIISKRKESVALRAEIAPAISEAVDAPRLVLDALEEFLEQKREKVGVTDKRWACTMVVQALFAEVNMQLDTKKAPDFSRSVVGRAQRILNQWKEMDGEGGGTGGIVGPAEAVTFLQMVVGFGLKSCFDEDFFRKLVVEHSARRDMAKLFVALGLGEKMTDVIDELVKNGKEIEAVYFASASGLTEKFPPIPLLKSYLRKSRKNATTIYGAAATEVELNSIRAIIKCVEDHKLESEFSLESLRKRSGLLEKIKAERKKSSQAPARPQNKRSHGASVGQGSGTPAYCPPKAAKYSNAHPSFSRRNPALPSHHSPAARDSGPYNYSRQTIYEAPTANPYASSYGVPHNQSPAARDSGPYHYSSQSMYEAPTANPYASSYGVPHNQSPAAIPQQHHTLPVDNVDGAGYSAGGSYGNQTSYGAYDYGSAALPTYEPSSYQQQ